MFDSFPASNIKLCSAVDPLNKNSFVDSHVCKFTAAELFNLNICLVLRQAHNPSGLFALVIFSCYMFLRGRDTKSFGQEEVRTRGYLGNVFRMWEEGAGLQPWPQTTLLLCKTSKQQGVKVKHLSQRLRGVLWVQSTAELETPKHDQNTQEVLKKMWVFVWALQTTQTLDDRWASGNATKNNYFKKEGRKSNHESDRTQRVQRIQGVTPWNYLIISVFLIFNS